MNRPKNAARPSWAKREADVTLAERRRVVGLVVIMFLSPSTRGLIKSLRDVGRFPGSRIDASPLPSQETPSGSIEERSPPTVAGAAMALGKRPVPCSLFILEGSDVTGIEACRHTANQKIGSSTGT
jgi:hypothetical protein